MQINFARASHLFLRFFAVTARQRRENAQFHVLWKTETGDKFFSLLTIPLSFLGIRESVTFRPSLVPRRSRLGQSWTLP